MSSHFYPRQGIPFTAPNTGVVQSSRSSPQQARQKLGYPMHIILMPVLRLWRWLVVIRPSQKYGMLRYGNVLNSDPCLPAAGYVPDFIGMEPQLISLVCSFRSQCSDQYVLHSNLDECCDCRWACSSASLTSPHTASVANCTWIVTCFPFKLKQSTC